MGAWRYVRGNKSTAQPQTLVFLDTETISEPTLGCPTERIERFRLGCAIHVRLESGKVTRRSVLQFSKTDNFWGWLQKYLSKSRTLWLWCHNAGFDATQVGLLSLIEDGEFRLSWPIGPTKDSAGSPVEQKKRKGIVCLDDPPTILECRHASGGLLKLVDTLNFWRLPLAELGESVKLDKLPMPSRDAPDIEWQEYCLRDCEILERVVLSLLEWHADHDLGQFRPTAASCAYGAWRHRFRGSEVVLHDETQVKELERAAYFGGQLEVYYLGPVVKRKNDGSAWLFDKEIHGLAYPSAPVIKLDVTGLYPSVMRDQLYPCKLVDWRLRPDREGADISDLDGTCIARVLIDSPADTYPLRERGRTLFARGLYWTTLAGPELSRALTAGHVVGLGWWASYRLADLFSSYVDFFWQLRFMAQLAGNGVEEGLCKLFLNSLYGKFGQRTPEWLDRPDVLPPIPWGGFLDYDRSASRLDQYRAIGWHCQQLVSRGEHNQAFPAIAAFVTAHGRERMRQFRSIAGAGNYYYQGVDSLFVSAHGLAALKKAGYVESCTLGKLRIEETADSAYFHGHNHYRIGEHRVIASIKRGATLLKDAEYQQDEFDHLSSTIERGPDNGVLVRRVVRKLSGPPIAGTVDRFGWVKPPWRDCRTYPQINPSDSTNSPPRAASEIACAQPVAPDLGSEATPS